MLAKPALYKWNNQMGLKGIDTEKYVDDKAAIGTLAHQMIADYLRKQETDTSEYSKKQIDQAENSVLSFFEWEKSHPIKPILIEQRLVSEDWCFGGTIDCFTGLNGKLELVDFKTSKGLYLEATLQVSAYAHLLHENGFHVEGVRILRIGRDEDEGFEEKVISNTKLPWELFKHCLSIHNIQRELKKEGK